MKNQDTVRRLRELANKIEGEGCDVHNAKFSDGEEIGHMGSSIIMHDVSIFIEYQEVVE